jgi:hypothetical protein
VDKSTHEQRTTDGCSHRDIDWDSEPDFAGCHGMSMYWFGYCYDCGTRVRQRYVPQKGVEVID